MREIKFRAWVKRQNRMVHVDIINFRKNELSFAENIGNWQVGGCWYPIETVDLMQFTGLHDKNGKEIFEGDVVKLENYRGAFVVKWSVPDISFVLYDPKEQSNHSLTDFAFFYTEVIGNIYENPELLEVEE